MVFYSHPFLFFGPPSSLIQLDLVISKFKSQSQHENPTHELQRCMDMKAWYGLESSNERMNESISIRMGESARNSYYLHIKVLEICYILCMWTMPSANPITSPITRVVPHEKKKRMV